MLFELEMEASTRQGGADEMGMMGRDGKARGVACCRKPAYVR